MDIKNKYKIHKNDIYLSIYNIYINILKIDKGNFYFKLVS